tara:strand:- start:1181 stop:1348 length:168 start_codon:yes stop_codon:yes gene_type:complete
MKDLSKKIREGGVQKFSGSQLGVSRNGKGDFPRFNYQTDEEYKKNYDAIDWGKKK